MPKVIKPRTLAFLAKTERRKVGASYIVTAMGLFDLARPDPDRFESEQALWLLAAKALPKGSVLDAGMPKPTAELLIGGSAQGPEGTTAMAVEWRVGPLHKRLVVFGDRYWTIAGGGYEATQPKPFVEMPLSPDRAFGGAGHADNPAGSGSRAAERIRAGELVALPNVERAERLLLSPDDRPPPALCGPMDLASPKRRRYAGTFDGHWVKNIAPAMPDDLDPRYYLSAPDDQIFEGFIQGGEPYALRGFSADIPEMRGTLPAFRVRGFLARKGQGDGEDDLVEIAMRADTLWLFAGARRGVLIYRGALPVEDVDAEDVSTAMIAYERASDAPRPYAHYLDAWRQRSDRKTAVRHVFSESQLAPALSPELETRRSTERTALARERLDKHLRGMAWAQNRQLDLAGIPMALRPPPPGNTDGDLEEALLSLPMPTPEEMEEGDFDLGAMLDGIEAVERKLREKTEAFSAQAKEVQGAFEALRAPGADTGSVDALFAALDDLAGSSSATAIDAGMARIEGPMPSAIAPQIGPDIEPALGPMKDWREMLLAGLGAPAADEDEALAAARARFLDLPEGRPLAAARPALEAARARDFSTPGFDDGAQPDAGATPAKPSELESLLAGLEQDVAAPDARVPSARDGFAKANAHLATTLPHLAGGTGSPLDALLDAVAGMSQGKAPDSQAPAALAKAKLDKASEDLDAQEASMIDAFATMRRTLPEPAYPQTPMAPALARRFGDVVLAEHRGGVTLRRRDMAGADLRGADLSGVDLEGALLERADLSGARLRGARLKDAALTGAILDGADLSDVDLSGANLAKCHAHEADFSRCRFAVRFLLEADFSGALFQGAQIDKVQAIKSTFDGADFSEVTLSNTSFIQSSLARTTWDRANLEASLFMDLALTGSHFRGARLFRCMVLKTQAADADFSGADVTRTAFVGEVDLTGACFAQATGIDSTFHEVTLTRATFERGRFDRATFVKSRSNGARFRLAQLRGALFGGANLVGADLVGANLLTAQLRRADLSGARLQGANLYGANLDQATLTATDLSGANLAKTLLAVDSHVG